MDCILPGSSVHGIFQAVWIFHTGVGCHLVNLRCSNKNYPRWASQVALVVKNLPTNAGDIRNAGSIHGSRRFSWRSIWQLTPLFFPGESHGQRSLADYSPWDLKESDMAEQLTLSLSYIILRLRNSKYEFLPYFGTVVDTLCHKIKYKYTSALFSTSIFFLNLQAALSNISM